MPVYLTDQSLFPSAAASIPLDVWTGSAHQTEALLGKSMQSTEWPPSLLPPPRTPAVSVLVLLLLAGPAPVAASPADARFNLSPFLQKITSGGRSRQTNAVSRMTSGQKNISSPSVNGGRSRQVNAVFRVTFHRETPVPSSAFLADECLCRDPDLLVCQPSEQELLQSLLTNSMDHAR